MPQDYPSAISASKLTIYDPIGIECHELWVPTPELESLLNDALAGISLEGLAIRTRSKIAKELVCKALGYPVPLKFKRTQPRFVGQQFDTYVQKSNNLQVWNEELSPKRRYVIIKVEDDNRISKVKIVYGEELALLSTTGTLTQKYQARLSPANETKELVTGSDTQNLEPHVHKAYVPDAGVSPIDNPRHRQLIPIQEVFQRLRIAVSMTFPDPGRDQERNRGAELHRLVCNLLGYSNYKDDGRFPDVRNQLIEVKLQTSSTINLGWVRPDSDAPLDIPKISDTQVRHMDVRYVLFNGDTDNKTITLTGIYVTTGEGFFDRFPQLGGKVVNEKLQILLPSDFFD